MALLRAAGPALDDPDERAIAARLLAAWADPPDGRALRAGVRLRLAQSDLGAVVTGEAGLADRPGLSLGVEPSLAGAAGRWWGAVTPRLTGRLADSGRIPPAPLLYAGWPLPTGAPVWRDARLAGGAWRLTWPRAVVGARLGGWALSLGWSPVRTGPGDGGGLLLDATGPAFPALTLRRAAPFAGRGPLRPFEPDALLLRVGRVSAQTVVIGDGWADAVARRDDPWFGQWLLAWTPARWLTAGASLSALAVPRSGSLLPDLLQVALPVLSTTRTEMERGPVTDRLFAVNLEGRWRRAPWPLLPSAAGRVYWEYAGEDFNPPGVVPLLPQISAPASVAGVELVGPRWDLAAEYTELEHPLVLWYGHSAFTAGYTHRGWLLGHPLGGTGASFAGAWRWRPRGTGLELALRGERATAGRCGLTPTRAVRRTWELALRPAHGLGAWGLEAARVDEQAIPCAPGVAGARTAWWRAALVLRH
ncbi:MAG: capsule assembly Wzi family protein [Candidatus Krumholzibacteriia bacterium]